jgi:hypothetical protein
MEIVMNLCGDFEDLTANAVMFRIDTDYVQDIISNKGFKHIPARAPKSAGVGGNLLLVTFR